MNTAYMIYSAHELDVESWTGRLVVVVVLDSSSQPSRPGSPGNVLLQYYLYNAETLGRRGPDNFLPQSFFCEQERRGDRLSPDESLGCVPGEEENKAL